MSLNSLNCSNSITNVNKQSAMSRWKTDSSYSYKEICERLDDDVESEIDWLRDSVDEKKKNLWNFMLEHGTEMYVVDADWPKPHKLDDKEGYYEALMLPHIFACRVAKVPMLVLTLGVEEYLPNIIEKLNKSLSDGSFPLKFDFPIFYFNDEDLF